ncbi:cupin domain-containing protein [Actinomyces bowdenii]|uniref:Cupin domain-containing protein n=1 Tax=Actinomyces bowdenii TaxID=131109 RepID=A0A853EL60_9ACTO|nr:cupin domain-containing protein [Actinomyces bowdenii]MBF0697412.1 cupin domain-containing protein [Actinomyces bowdenii]NYS69585.1 cupin domain-containing protein [Actinomyces bowdenii]
MAIADNGPKPNAFDIETATTENTTYRTVAWTGKYLQVTLMSIPVGESIGLETHPETDQFLRIDAGQGRCVMGPSQDDLSFTQEVSDGWSIQVPAGTWHDIINTGEEPLRLYTVYAPVHHAQGIVQATAAQAEADEEAGRDEPPSWTVQPGAGAADGHA